MAALTTTVAGAQAKAADVQQFMDLLTGVMTGQAVTIANAFTGRTIGATGQTALGSPGATKFIGRWTTNGAPTGLTGAIGDYGIDGGNTWWYCTGIGTPGTWIQMSPPPNTIAGNIVALGAAAAAGASGLSADASHIHPWTGLGVLSVAGTWTADQNFGTHLLGTLQTAAQPNITSLGTLTSLTSSGGISGTTLTGTIQTAAQPNITSLGTLTSLALSGAISGVTTLTATTLNGTLGTAAQPNVTSLGTLTSLNMSGALTGVTTGVFSSDLRTAGRLIAGADPGGGAAGDHIANRGGASPGTGAVYFGSSGGSKLIYYDGSSFQFIGAGINLNNNGIVNGGPVSGVSTLDTTGLATFPSYQQSSGVWNGTHYQAVIGWGNQARQIFTNSTRDDTKTIEGDILING